MHGKSTDIHITGTELYFLPIKTRVPLKFGPETLTEVTCARARVWVEDERGRKAEGWGETPLSVQWVWPSQLSHAARHAMLKEFSIRLAGAFSKFNVHGHPMEIGHDFQEQVLPGMLQKLNQECVGNEPMPYLAALVCCSLFDLAIHDAYGKVHGVPTFETFGPEFMNRDLASYVEAVDPAISFAGKYPKDFLLPKRREQLPAWHLVGGLDPLDATELTGAEPQDGYPVLLADWIKTDGLKCLKVKLRGNDARWDYERLVRVGQIGFANGVEALTADFNCTVQEPKYVNEILDRLKAEHPRHYESILYVEQPFPYELEQHRIDVHSVSNRRPLFLDESAHDWRLVRLGRELGWTGVALKTCKTLTGALLSACWAKAHGMSLMVQDLTNPMLAQISHVLLAAHLDTLMGVETNSMQFYPEASKPEEAVHPGIYRRRKGEVDLSSIRGPGLGYRIAEIQRTLPESVVNFGV
ncbi:MAG: enolase superfamily enzyme related to L-alanine-DL-glutamate epimerase [Pedosphaera sp.]|nr:enolase superfamily enzyme related to L-alanine-DL-glutamate epimerase [Pedosphaera sp.]